MQIAGLQKTTFVDYPGLIAATVFTRGCSFRCPFCHNPELVIPEKFTPLLNTEEVMAFLKKRAGQLEGICITGGEPTLQPDLPEFIAELKNLGYKVKLDSNGWSPEILKKLIEKGNIDYIAMDIKSPLHKYEVVTNSKLDPSRLRLAEAETRMFETNSNDKNSKQFKTFENYNFDIVSDFGFRISDLQIKIKKSIDLIMSSGVDYEFRTTVVKPIHKVEDFEEIGKMIKGAKRYYIQNFVKSKHIDEKNNFEPFSDEELEKATNIVKSYVNIVEVR